MAITPADFKLRYPEFASIADSRVQLFLDDAVLYLDEARAGIYYEKLIFLLTAHLLALSLKNESGVNIGTGVVGSMSEGDTSISFSTPQSNSNSEFFYQQTSYGIEYLNWLTFLGRGGLIV